MPCMRNIIAYLSFILLFYREVSAQKDSLQLQEVSVTATRSEKLLSRIPLPCQIINYNSIKSLSQNRLQDVLGEQAGLMVVPQINGLGNGIQIQGLNPDYTLILIDGEPIIGRYAGSLELSRISTFNIRKIEIVKGPSSSLYGSDALAGVINIITEQSLVPKLNFGIRAASRNSYDFNMNAAYVQPKWRAIFSLDHYRTNGYDLSPEVFGQTVSPYRNFTMSGKLFFNPSARHEIILNLRGFKEYQENRYQVFNAGDTSGIKVEGNGTVSDWNIIPTYKFKWNSKLNFQVRTYGSGYETQTDLNHLNASTVFYKDRFQQYYFREEFITNYTLQEKNKIILGVGQIQETVESNRYGDDKSRNQHTKYGFVQFESDVLKNLSFIAGVRLDKNTTYAMQWSPKLALLYQASHRLQFKASAGTGFKAPDFRQLYLNFNNDAASYSVFGTEVIQNEMKRLASLGLIAQYFTDVSKIGTVQAETSVAFNTSANYQLNDQFFVDLNFFRNDIKGLIETQLIASTTNQKNIYSYTNIKRAYTTGLEINTNYTLNSKLSTQLGYQYLIAKDKDVSELIANGNLFGRDPVSLVTYRLRSSDYFGLANRSRNQVSFKINYKIPKWKTDVQCRINYRGKFGLFSTSGNVSGVVVPPSDQNSNGVLDKYDHFVPAYFLVNLTIGKMLTSKMECRIGAENIANYTDPIHIPTLIGRNLFIQIHYNFIKS